MGEGKRFQGKDGLIGPLRKCASKQSLNLFVLHCRRDVLVNKSRMLARCRHVTTYNAAHIGCGVAVQGKMARSNPDKAQMMIYSFEARNSSGWAKPASSHVQIFPITSLYQHQSSA
jgi:hypothetical protein